MTAIINLPLRCRVKWIFQTEPAAWGGLSTPVKGYIEPSNLGPIPLREVEWLELDSMEHQRRGVLVADLEIDRSDDIEAALTECRLAFSKESKIYRVFGYRESVSDNSE